MKPVIGIIASLTKRRISVGQEYVSAIVSSGGLPYLIPVPFSGRDEVRISVDDVKGITRLVDGLLLPGGGDLVPAYYGEEPLVPLTYLKLVETARSDFEIELIGEMVRSKKPLLGICYGMQLINVSLGGSLYQDIRHQLGGSLDHRNNLHEIEISHASELPGRLGPEVWNTRPSSIIVNSFHHQAVKKTADGLEIFGMSKDGIIEGVYKRDHPFLLGVQWHPERNQDGEFSSRLFSSFIDAARQSSKIHWSSDRLTGDYAF
ncbi:MAG: gamma-glutamyl-gamma-aminobutyrate hydrolase family protein [Dissulfurispiraceae bacterium]